MGAAVQMIFAPWNTLCIRLAAHIYSPLSDSSSYSNTSGSPLSPTRAKCFQSESHTLATELNRRGHMRKRVASVLPYRVAPKVQPCVGFLKLILRLH